MKEEVISSEMIINTNRKKVFWHNNGDIEIIDSIYETDYSSLKREFIKDYNNLFLNDFTDFIDIDFYIHTYHGTIQQVMMVSISQ